jgi:hypothetical protein
MIARYHNFIAKIEFLEVLEEGEEIFLSAVVGEIACVDEDVATHRQDPIELLVTAVGVRHDDHIQFLPRLPHHFLLSTLTPFLLFLYWSGFFFWDVLHTL